MNVGKIAWAAVNDKGEIADHWEGVSISEYKDSVQRDIKLCNLKGFTSKKIKVILVNDDEPTGRNRK